MAKKQDSQKDLLEPQAQEQETQEREGTGLVETLMQEGEITLTAESRADIYAQSEEVVAGIPEGTEWIRNAVEYDPETGVFSQKIILKQE